ncbi:enolase, N-terminal domain protein, partial [Vibrio parahaemolyticus VPTS-2010]
SYVTVTKHVS